MSKRKIYLIAICNFIIASAFVAFFVLVIFKVPTISGLLFSGLMTTFAFQGGF